MDRISQIWPAWHTVELIGRGAYGEVYKAKREIQGETFYSAVKVIQIPREEGEVREMISDGMTSQSIQSYYQSIAKGVMNEIRTLETLKSAGNVVNIEDFDVREREDAIGWEVYIRMELLQNLDAYRREHPLDAREVAKLGGDICKALEYCEQSHIIHRDIKPSNIFVDRYGNFKLGDFGIARQMEKTQGTLSRKGTELYMAPEVRFGESGSSYNVDLYSLGLVMYRLLNRNRMPFEPLPSEKEFLLQQDKEEALVRRLKGEEPSPPADADPVLGSIILRACQADKEKRYQSARQMRQDLESWNRNGQKTASGPADKMAGAGTEAGGTVKKEEDTPVKESRNPYEDSRGDRLDETVSVFGERKTDFSETDAAKANSTETAEDQTAGNQMAEDQGTGNQTTESPKTEEQKQGEEPPLYSFQQYKSTDYGKPEKSGKKNRYAFIAVAAVLVVALVAGIWHFRVQSARDRLFETAQSSLEAGDYEEARTRFEEGMEEYPEDERGYLGLAEVYGAQEEYDEALKILADGSSACQDTDGKIALLISKMEEKKADQEYTDKIEEADGLAEAGDFEGAEAAYKEAIEMDDSRTEAPGGLMTLLIRQNRIDEVTASLDAGEYSFSEGEVDDLKDACTLQQIYSMMQSSDYAGLLAYFKGDRAQLGTGIYYYQNGQKLDEIAEGSGMILSTYGVYAGDVQDSQRNGNGKQFGIYADSDTQYTVTEGVWSGDAANGQCTYSEYREVDSNGEEWNWTYSGNVSGNLFNGDIAISWSHPDGSDADSGTAHAENGTFSCIREEAGSQYVYVEGGSGRYWFYTSADDLSNQGIWKAYIY